ncbi:FCD domain-containing protein [Streptomyces monashensis]|uniref:FCD domain-containing protein n=1 Tax=Streptomyces monashensis TaxID=1678012 RepID=UPI0033D23A92
MGPERLTARREALAAQRRATDEADAHAVIPANKAFRFAPFEQCDSQWLLRFVRQWWEARNPIAPCALVSRRIAAPEDRLRADEILREHEAALVKPEAGDTDGALQELTRHRGSGQEDFHRLRHSRADSVRLLADAARHGPAEPPRHATTAPPAVV